MITVIVAVFLLPKRFSRLLTTFILLFNVFLGQTVDFLIGAPPYDLYDTNDSEKYEYMDSVLYLFTYPLNAYIMLSIYQRWKMKGLVRALYIGGWAFVTMCLEWVSKLAHVFTYKGWYLLYSFFVYIGVFTLNVLMLHLAKSLLHPKEPA